MAEITAQAVAEIRALTGWLLGKGCPAVALWGISYGAWLSGLTVCREARLAAAVLTIPGVRANPAFGELVVWRRIRKILQERRAAWEALNLTVYNLATSRPAIPSEKILLIDAIHDLFAPGYTEELWQAWGQPDLWRLPHGHISITCMTAPGMTGPCPPVAGAAVEPAGQANGSNLKVESAFGLHSGSISACYKSGIARIFTPLLWPW